MEDIISFVGPRAAGKSTIGKELAKKLGYEYIDLDAVMNNELKSDGGVFGYPKKYSWNKYMGEVHRVLVSIFRDIKDKKVVLDLGGGTIAAPGFPEAELNANLAQKHTKILLLLPTADDDENIKILFSREKERRDTISTYYAKGWPDEILLEKITKDYFERVPILKKYAKHHIYSKKLSPTEVADFIERTILKNNNS